MASIVVGKEFSEILERIERSEAVVLTAEEVSRLVEDEDRSSLEEVDVVTTATRAVMSGTYAILSFPVAEPGSFQRARNVWLNGISAQVGPCPNENLGLLDLIVFGTACSRDRPDYGGGHLFRDLVREGRFRWRSNGRGRIAAGRQVGGYAHAGCSAPPCLQELRLSIRLPVRDHLSCGA